MMFTDLPDEDVLLQNTKVVFLRFYVLNIPSSDASASTGFHPRREYRRILYTRVYPAPTKISVDSVTTDKGGSI